jgi:hypothetical protein
MGVTLQRGGHFGRRLESFCRLHSVGNFLRRTPEERQARLKEIKKLLLAI